MLSFVNMLYVQASSKCYKFAREERGAVDLIVIVVLIGVAVALAMLFKTEMTTLIQNLLDDITIAAGDATSSVSTSTP